MDGPESHDVVRKNTNGDNYDEWQLLERCCRQCLH